MKKIIKEYAEIVKYVDDLIAKEKQKKETEQNISFGLA